MLNFEQRSGLLKVLKPKIKGRKEALDKKLEVYKCLSELSRELIISEDLKDIPSEYLVKTEMFCPNSLSSFLSALEVDKVVVPNYADYTERSESSEFYQLNFKRNPIYLGDFLSKPKRLQEKYPEIIKKFSDNLKDMVKYRNMYEENLKSIMRVLEIRELNITAIKKNFPELYNDFKKDGVDKGN